VFIGLIVNGTYQEPLEEQQFLDNWREQVGDLFSDHVDVVLLEVGRNPPVFKPLIYISVGQLPVDTHPCVPSGRRRHFLKHIIVLPSLCFAV
jgi:hypothetical protein